MIGFDPIVGPEPRALVLGTAPSERSLREGRYYAHPRNDFWPIMERLFSDGRPLDYAERVEMLKDARVALWDVLAEAERVGSLDANITAPVANDLSRFLRDHPSIGTVFFNGATAERLFEVHCASSFADGAVRFVRLPSTSPANATISSALKLAAWKAVRDAAGDVASVASRPTAALEPTDAAEPAVAPIRIIQPSTPEQLEAFRGLLREWFDFLVNDAGIDMGYQSIEAELAGLPGYYGPPSGRAWLAYGDAGDAVGCVALRPLADEGVCELKRLYVRPAQRGGGIGRALTVQAIDEARAMGYELMRLDTGTFLDASRRLYGSLGFVERGPYYDVPPDVLRVTVFMELRLA